MHLWLLTGEFSPFLFIIINTKTYFMFSIFHALIYFFPTFHWIEQKFFCTEFESYILYFYFSKGYSELNTTFPNRQVWLCKFWLMKCKQKCGTFRKNLLKGKR